MHRRFPRILQPGLQAPPLFRHRTPLHGHVIRCSYAKITNGSKIQSSAAKLGKTTTISAKDLPQGLVISDALPPIDDTIVMGYPTVVQQVRNNMQKFHGCVILTRVGNFYELYFEQAEEYGRLLNLKVASKKTSAGPVPMSGFPFYQLDRYLKVLVHEHGKHVAVSEEIPIKAEQRIKSGGLMFDRQVQRVITPGTLIDETFIDPLAHNYLLAIVGSEYLEIRNDTSQAEQVVGSSVGPKNLKLGLAWLDLTSGEVCTQFTKLDSLASAISRIGPREIVIEQNLQTLLGSMLGPILQDYGQAIAYHQTSTTERKQLLSSDDGKDDFTVEETSSISLLYDYTAQQLPGLDLHLQAPVRHEEKDYMLIDKNSLKGLEINQTLRDGLYKGSLLHATRRTSTESGARLLAQRLSAPSLSLDVINERLDLIEEFMEKGSFLDTLTSLLKKTSDTLRLVQKFSFGRGDAQDLLDLSETIVLTRDIGSILQDCRGVKTNSLQLLSNRFNWSGPADLADRIAQTIDRDGLLTRQHSEENEAAEAAGLARQVLAGDASEDLAHLSKRLDAKRFKKSIEADDSKSLFEDIWIMRKDASPTLTILHTTLSNLQDQQISLTNGLQEQLGTSTLSLKMTPGLGYICHVRGKDVKADFSTVEGHRTVSTSKSTRSFYLKQWTDLAQRMDQARLRIRTEEQFIFRSLREEVIQNLKPLRRNAAVLDELDISCSFTRLAIEHNLQRPQLNESINAHQIIQGRHMTVESGLADSGRTFTPNDCHLSAAERIWLITGPNMAGKSTFLRQIALISILAQTGSFVPAAHASLGLVDRIFSRIGSADNLAQDQSTFMVEMLETAQILRHATPRSFVIMDEVGRGTTPEDGIAVGYAVLYHLQKVNKCRTLFATHFHALADMTRDWSGLACYCTDVIEESDGAFRYDHRMRKGINRASHALKVAHLAGMPQDVLDLAKETLVKLGVDSKAPQ